MKWPWKKQSEIRPPKVGGTRAPEQVLRIDFLKPHDFHFQLGHSGAMTIFRRCVLIGFTSPMDREREQQFAEERWTGHDRWLVLRQSGGRLVYVPREGLAFIEESDVETKNDA